MGQRMQNYPHMQPHLKNWYPNEFLSRVWEHHEHLLHIKKIMQYIKQYRISWRLRYKCTPSIFQGISKTHFHLKQARQSVHSCLEHFIRQNHLGCSDHNPQKNKDAVVVASPPEVTGPSPSDWDKFVQSLGRHCSQPGTLDANGR